MRAQVKAPIPKLPSILTPVKKSEEEQIEWDHTNYNLRKRRWVDYKILEDNEEFDKDDEYEEDFKRDKSQNEHSKRP